MARTKVKAGKKRGNTVSLNWGDAELKNYLTKEGTFLFKVTKAEEGDSDNIIIDAEVVSDKQEGKTCRTYFSTQPQALWKLAQFLEAVGMEIPESEDDLDLEELVDKEFVGEVERHEYNDKIYHRIQNFTTADEFEDEGGGKKKEKEPNKGRDKKKAKEEPADDLTEDAILEMEREELEALIENHELEVEADDIKSDKKLARTIIAELEEKGVLGEAKEEVEEEEEKPAAKRGRGRPPGAKNKKSKADEDEEDDKPAKGKAGKKGGKLPKVTAEEIEDMSEEELDDLVDKYGFEDVDLSTARTLRKKAALVLDALEAAELLEEA
jgi:hypothetical protein